MKRTVLMLLLIGIACPPTFGQSQKSRFIHELDDWMAEGATAEDVMRRLDDLFPPDAFERLNREIKAKAKRSAEIRESAAREAAAAAAASAAYRDSIAAAQAEAQAKTQEARLYQRSQLIDPETGKLRYGPVSHGSVMQRGDLVIVRSGPDEPRGDPPRNHVWLFRYDEDAAANQNARTAKADPPGLGGDRLRALALQSAEKANIRFPFLADPKHPSRVYFDDWLAANFHLPKYARLFALSSWPELAAHECAKQAGW